MHPIGIGTVNKGEDAQYIFDITVKHCTPALASCEVTTIPKERVRAIVVWPVLVGLEGILYAVAMRILAGYVVGRMPLDAGAPVAVRPCRFGDVARRRLLLKSWCFGPGCSGSALRLVRALLGASVGFARIFSWLGVAVVASALFSGWHYYGEFG